MMKKLFFVAAAILGITSCATSELDGYTPSASDKMKEVTVTVSTSQTGDQATRVAIEEDADSGDLLLTWADNDALGGWSWNASSFSIFEIDNESIDSTRKSATFNGSIYEEDDYYRLMHPYIAGAEFTDQTYTIDFAAQSTDMEQDEYYTLGQGLYMISSSIDSRGTEAPVMMHIGAVLDINLRFENLPEDVSVKLASLKIEGSETLEIPQSATIDFRHDVADDSFVKSSTGGAIEVEAKNSPALSATETYTLKASTMPFTFGADEELTMTVVLTSSTTKYTKSFTLANNSGDAIEVERAMYLTLNKMCDMDGAEQSAIDGLWDGSIADDFSGGDGSSTDPYLISSAAELAKLAQNYSNYSGGTCFALTCEINLGGLPWTPIGNYDDRFDHTFDGRGYTISGLYIDSEEPFQGLFGYVNDGTIANLTVEGEVTTTDQNCAGITGMAKNATLLNCHNRAKVTGTSRVGGVAGGAGSSYIINCSNAGTIVGNDCEAGDADWDETETMQRVGGISGTSGFSTYVNCYNAGSVTNLSGEAFAFAALSGYTYADVRVDYCYYDNACGGTDTVNATAKSAIYLKSDEFVAELNEKAKYGSIIAANLGNSLLYTTTWEIGQDGYPTTTMEASETIEFTGLGSMNSPYLISSAEDMINFAQFVNYGKDFSGEFVQLTCDIDLEGSSSNPWSSIGNNLCRFMGLFNGDGHTVSGLYVSSDSSYQGLFGYTMNAMVVNLTVEGEVHAADQCAGIIGMCYCSTMINCHNKATVTGLSRVGGVAGGAGNSGIYNCSNTGIITGDDNTSGDGDWQSDSMQRVGGVAGTSGNTYLYNCFNAGQVTNLSGDAFALAAASGSDYASTYAKFNYYSEDCGGVDSNGLASSLSASYMTSTDFVDELNTNAGIFNGFISFTADWGFNEWVAVEDSYPVTNMTKVGVVGLYEDLVGQGTEDSPYLISSVEELETISTIVALGGSFESSYLSLTCDLDLGGSSSNQWEPIGAEGVEFMGYFEGGGHTISGLYIDSRAPFQALFGFVYYGEIYNLTVEGQVTTTDQNSAGIAGMAKYTTILNCHNRATIKGTSRVGGVAGGAGYATIYNCSNTGTITGDDYSESNGSSGMVERVGGIAGTSAVTYLYNCFNAGAVSNLAGQAYALAAPSGDDNYSTYTTYCYYDENCGGVNTNTSASGVSSSYMLSAEFVDLLNEKAIYLRKIDGKDLKFWESVDGSYPTTTMEDAVESSTTSSLIELDGDFSDWDAVSADALATASMDGYTSGYPDLLEMKFCADETYIYTYFKIETANNNHELLIFINSTGDAADGYSSWMWDGSLYADYMIISTASGNYADDAALYAFDTADTSLQWSWIWTGVTGNSLYSISDVVTDGTIVEFEGRIVRDSMTGLGDEIEVGVMIDDNNWATIGVLPALTTGGAQAPLIVKLP